jgi:hypothetical protein
MLVFEETTARTRELMLETSAHDGYQPANLTAVGLVRYREALANHLSQGDVTSLHAEVTTFPNDCVRGDKRGVVPVDWARRLTVTDWISLWNCARARELLEQGETHAIVVRVGVAYVPRGECENIEGLAVPLDLVASGFRAKYYPAPNKSAFSLPVGPNCHHGIRRLTNAEKARPYVEQTINGVMYRQYDVGPTLAI